MIDTGLFDRLFGNRPKPTGKEESVKMLTGYEPSFHRFGGDIYESELVRAAIGAIATQISKLAVTVEGSAKPALQVKLRHGPNQLETWSQFLYRLATILYVHNTAFVVPVFDEMGEISGIFPALPEECEVVTYGDTLFLRYKFTVQNIPTRMELVTEDLGDARFNGHRLMFHTQDRDCRK